MTPEEATAAKYAAAIVERRRLALRAKQGPPLTPAEAERLRQLDGWLDGWLDEIHKKRIKGDT